MSNERTSGWPPAAEAALDVLERFGVELQHAEQAAQQIRIILTSGNTVLPADNAGLFLPKPYDVDHAVSVVFETLGLKRPSSP